MMSSGQQQSVRPVSRDTQSVLLSVLFYSIMMVTLPVTMYFVTQYVFARAFTLKSTDSYVYAAAVAVITVHVILGLFVYKAYKETDDSPASGFKRD